MLSFMRKARAARLSLTGGLALVLGTSALTLFAGASPALATAANCADSGTGYAAREVSTNPDHTWNLSWYQVWYKQVRLSGGGCNDFYLTYQGARDTYRGFYKASNDPAWWAGDPGPKTLGAGSDGNMGVDMVTDLAIGTQLNIGTSTGGQYVTVAF